MVTAAWPKSTRVRHLFETARTCVVDTLESVTIVDPEGIRLRDAVSDGALDGLRDLHRTFQQRRAELLLMRKRARSAFRAGDLPRLRADTTALRTEEWTAAPLPRHLTDRRIEITVPVDAACLGAALASGARVVMADFETATADDWGRIADGYANVRDHWRAVTRSRSEDDAPSAGPMPVLMPRLRDLRRNEEHVLVDGEAIAAPFADLGLTLVRNAEIQWDEAVGPYVYLPNIESHEEAVFWNDVLAHIENAVGFTPGTIKASVVLASLPAAFQMDEILHALKNRVVAVGWSRWAYLASAIAVLDGQPSFVLPDRDRIVAGRGMLRALSRRMIATCHRRGVLALGSRATRLPTASDGDVAFEALEKLRADVERDLMDGQDGVRVSHPMLVAPTLEVLDRVSPGPNQLEHPGEAVPRSQTSLLEGYEGRRTLAGLREALAIAVVVGEARLRGYGSVVFAHEMHDSSSAAFALALVRHWIARGAALHDGRTIDRELVEAALYAEGDALRERVGEKSWENGRFDEAVADLRAALDIGAGPALHERTGRFT